METIPCLDTSGPNVNTGNLIFSLVTMLHMKNKHAQFDVPSLSANALFALEECPMKRRSHG